MFKLFIMFTQTLFPPLFPSSSSSLFISLTPHLPPAAVVRLPVLSVLLSQAGQGPLLADMLHSQLQWMNRNQVKRGHCLASNLLIAYLFLYYWCCRANRCVLTVQRRVNPLIRRLPFSTSFTGCYLATCEASSLSSTSCCCIQQPAQRCCYPWARCLIGVRSSGSSCGKSVCCSMHCNLNEVCCFRYSNPSEIRWQLEADEAYEYRKFRGLDKRRFSFMAASEALQVTSTR